MLGLAAVSEAPLSTGAQAEAPPARVWILSRVVREGAKFPQATSLRGHSIRYEGVDEDWQDYRVDPSISRFLYAQPPHKSLLRGHTTRREGIEEDWQDYRILPSTHRFLHGQPPHPSRLSGDFYRQKGIPDDVPELKTLPNIFRILRGKPPHPSDLTGKATRRDGFSEDFYIRILPRRAKSHSPHPSSLLGRVKHWHGYPILLPRVPARFLHGQPPDKSLLRGHTLRRDGYSPDWIDFGPQVYQQGFRVADATYDRYELFVGEDAAANLNGPPIATSAVLPFSYTPTPPTSGTKTLHIVVRRRNKYSLQSFNVFETIRVINTSTLEVFGPVSAPQDVTVYDGLSGYIRILATYLPESDANPADKWEVYVKIGSAPVIGVDPVTYTADMLGTGFAEVLQATIGAYTPGTTAYVLVAALRSSDSVRGVANIVLHVLAVVPPLDDGLLFGGSIYEQR